MRKRSYVAIALPGTILAFLVMWFLASLAPQIQQNEDARAEAEAKIVSELLKKKAATSDFIWEYAHGIIDGDTTWNELYPSKMTWKEWGSKGERMKYGTWGYHDYPSGNGRLVWVRQGRQAYAKFTNIKSFNYLRLFRIMGPIIIGFCLFMTIAAIWALRNWAKCRDDFLCAIAHDLTTPLVALRYMLETKAEKDDLEDAMNVVSRLLKVIDNIHQFMNLGAKREMKKEIFDIRRACLEAYKIFEADFRDIYGGEDIDFTGLERLDVVGDELAVVQVFWNLLGNELKYAASYGRVSIDFSIEAQRAKVTISDEGEGLTRKQMARIFNRYYRAREAKKSGMKGYGIGLCVSKELLDAMGGSISVHSAKPHGLVWTILLPLWTAE